MTGPDERVVLVVDDDPDFLEQHRVLLEGAGWNVVTAGGSDEAQSILADRRPDLAIVDLMMEYDDSGFILCRHIKQCYPQVPVILVTAVTSETGFEFSVGSDGERSWIKADAVLAKPIRFEQLQREIDRLMG